MRFNGESIDSFQFLIESDDAFLKLAQSYSEAIDRFGVLYLLGLKDDFAAVIGKMKKESEARSERIGKMMREIMKNSKFVRAEWPVVVPHIPGQESETVIFLDAKAIHFLGDLEGAREEAFKKQTASLFHQCGNVKVAYLARLFGQNVPTTAALCLVTKPNFEKTMIQAVGKIFAELFDLQESFNVVFLNSDQDADLAKVCKPFYAV